MAESPESEMDVFSHEVKCRLRAITILSESYKAPIKHQVLALYKFTYLLASDNPSFKYFKRILHRIMKFENVYRMTKAAEKICQLLSIAFKATYKTAFPDDIHFFDIVFYLRRRLIFISQEFGSEVDCRSFRDDISVGSSTTSFSDLGDRLETAAGELTAVIDGLAELHMQRLLKCARVGYNCYIQPMFNNVVRGSHGVTEVFPRKWWNESWKVKNFSGTFDKKFLQFIGTLKRCNDIKELIACNGGHTCFYCYRDNWSSGSAVDFVILNGCAHLFCEPCFRKIRLENYP